VTLLPEDLDVLAAGVQHLDDLGLGDQLEERGEVDSLRLRIDDRFDAGTGDLDEAQLRPIGRVAHKFCVESDVRCGGEFLRQHFQIGRGFDDPHQLCIADSRGPGAWLNDLATMGQGDMIGKMSHFAVAGSGNFTGCASRWARGSLTTRV